MIRIKRIYAPADPADGYRVLVDRLWPRGLSREAAAIDEWYRDLAPSNELRRWYGHRDDRWPEFQRRYREELAAPELAPRLDALRRQAAAGPLTLLFSTRAETRNNATVLREVLLES